MSNVQEISEGLEAVLGKPRNITEENVQFCLRLVAEQIEDGKVNEGVPEPSTDAFAITIIAVMSYTNKTWEECAKVPAVRRTLKYVSLRCNRGHYDEIEKKVKALMKTYHKGLDAQKCLKFLKIIRLLKNDQPTKFIDCINYPAQYDAISNGLHQLISTKKPGDAALYIVCAIEDTLLSVDLSRQLIIDEFSLKKSAFNEAYTKYSENKGVAKNELDYIVRKKELVKTHLRATIGYTFDGTTVKFIDHRMKNRNLLTLCIGWFRRQLQ